MSFAPGELSTIAGTLGSIEEPWSTANAKSFRLADLPCPPRSVMEEKWYSPRPGEPYQPWLAAPKQFSTFGGRPLCGAWLFSAIDPPKALTVGSFMAAEVPLQPQSGCPEPCAIFTGSAKALTSANMMLPTNPPTPMPRPAVKNQPTATDLQHHSVTPSTSGDQLVAGQKHENAEKLRYDYQAFTLAVGGMSLIFDVIILIYPIPVIRNLHMKGKKKLQVIGIFWLAGFNVDLKFS